MGGIELQRGGRINSGRRELEVDRFNRTPPTPCLISIKYKTTEKQTMEKTPRHSGEKSNTQWRKPLLNM